MRIESWAFLLLAVLLPAIVTMEVRSKSHVWQLTALVIAVVSFTGLPLVLLLHWAIPGLELISSPPRTEQHSAPLAGD
jgi:hypothetical protein